MDGFIVADVVADIDLWRGVMWGQPDGVDAEGVEVGKAGDEAGDVADPVAVGVLEGGGVDLVDCGLFPPGLGVGHGALLGVGTRDLLFFSAILEALQRRTTGLSSGTLRSVRFSSKRLSFYSASHSCRIEPLAVRPSQLPLMLHGWL